ncbi:hypothetical protein COUCH_15605 [Couchioplanes caeruleus]|uniref:MarR family winged helix-turn-helix transcriptional regulator n=1 Tax=Couchioplanes caeruleus TaxID=56438 RepID=UPI0020BED086|nr:hypothetical protein [Couchioplanes caeruleus]UQU67605.1 hypothetical protein COUCH_15605 [Couchioplanes caeruleus]
MQEPPGVQMLPTSSAELIAFETATKDLVGVALRSLELLEGEVSLPQFRLMLLLAERGRTTSTQAADALGLAGSSITRLGDRLNTSGHLLRGTDPANRSVVTLELTARGHDLVAQVTNRRRQELSRALDGLEPSERAACARGLRALHERLGADYTIGLHGPMPL